MMRTKILETPMDADGTPMNADKSWQRENDAMRCSRQLCL
jgi:hypothetical protein